MWAHRDSHKDLHDPERISIRMTGSGGKRNGFVDLRQTDCQICLLQRQIYWGSTKNCSLRSATRLASLPHTKGRNIFIERKRKLGGLQ